MPTNSFKLFKSQRFFPLFLTQFLGAFNDNIYKNALVILITYQFAQEFHLDAEILITLAAGIFILPFFLFSATSGQLADKFEKSRLIRYIKWAEVILVLIACVGFYLHSVYLLMFVLFLLGTHSTFFGPLKYSILPDLLKENELVAGNGLIEAGTFLAILSGTILGGILVIFPSGEWWVSWTIVMVAFLGLVASYGIPKTKAAMPDLSLNINFLQETWRIIEYSTKKREIFISILGISWFWLVGATYLSQFPTYGKVVLGVEAPVVTLFLTLFSIGVGIGSLLCNRLLNGNVRSTYVFAALLGITFFGADLVLASSVSHHAMGKLISLSEFLRTPHYWRIMADLLFLAICGGVYIVPLYVILQLRSDPRHRSRVIASNNIMNAFFMVIAAVGTAFMLARQFSVSDVFLVVTTLNLFAAFYMRRPIRNY